MNFNEYFYNMLTWDEQADFVDEWYTINPHAMDEWMGNMNLLEVVYTTEEINKTVDEWYEMNN